MAHKRYTIYDAPVVHSIMLSTGLSVIEYLRDNPTADSEKINGFVENNFDDIIGSAIRDLKRANDGRNTGGTG